MIKNMKNENMYKKKNLLSVRGQGKGLSFLCVFIFLLAIYHCVIFCTSY